MTMQLGWTRWAISDALTLIAAWVPELKAGNLTRSGFSMIPCSNLSIKNRQATNPGQWGGIYKLAVRRCVVFQIPNMHIFLRSDWSYTIFGPQAHPAFEPWSKPWSSWVKTMKTIKGRCNYIPACARHQKPQKLCPGSSKMRRTYELYSEYIRPSSSWISNIHKTIRRSENEEQPKWAFLCPTTGCCR